MRPGKFTERRMNERSTERDSFRSCPNWNRHRKPFKVLQFVDTIDLAKGRKRQLQKSCRARNDVMAVIIPFVPYFEVLNLIIFLLLWPNRAKTIKGNRAAIKADDKRRHPNMAVFPDGACVGALATNENKSSPGNWANFQITNTLDRNCTKLLPCSAFLYNLSPWQVLLGSATHTQYSVTE